MATATIRADYDELKNAAGRFGSQAEAARQTLRRLQTGLGALQGGGWLGQGASAFYQEMDSSVLPAFERLITALEAAADHTGQIGAIMHDAEDQAAQVLNGSTATGAPADNRAASGGAVGSGTLGGGPDPRGIAAGLNAPGPNLTPPNTSRSTGTESERELAELGLGAGVISILEAGGSVAAAGIGTTMGSLLLPIAGFLLGDQIAEEGERREQLIQDFKTGLQASAITDATQRAVSQLQATGATVKPLNAQGQAAANIATEILKRRMEGEITNQLIVDAGVYHAHLEQVWQAHYDDWVGQLSQHLAGIYTDPAQTR